MGGHLDADSIRPMLAPAAVLAHFEREYQPRYGQLCVRWCPRCGDRSRGRCYVHAESGAWCCHRCRARGDIFALVAACAGLDVRLDFPRVLEIAARIAGLDSTMSMAGDKRLVIERRQRDAEFTEREQRRAAESRASMPATWALLERRDARGEECLRDRGLDPTALRERDVVRFTRAGEPAVALRNLASGAIVGIQYRRLVVGYNEPRVLSFASSQVAGACLHGRVTGLVAGSCEDAVITEGLADTLTACLAWLGCEILGAPGASQLKTVATAVAPRVAAVGGVLLIVADDDQAGREGAAHAVAAAERAGLALVPMDAPRTPATVRLVDLGCGLDGRRHHDLNDAWKESTWQWRWPELRSDA